MAELDRKEIAVAIWPWREKSASAKEAAAVPKRQRVLLEALVMGGVAGLLILMRKFWVAAVVGALAVFVLVAGLLVPRLYFDFKKAGNQLGRAVGIGLSWLLLIPVFYLGFTAGRLLLILARKDPLARRFPTREHTYWTPRKPIVGPEHYMRQY